MPSSCRSAGDSEPAPGTAAPAATPNLSFSRLARAIWAIRFRSLGSPCEVLVQTCDERAPEQLGTAAGAEAARIERKYSRYREDSIVAAIHKACGSATRVDAETAALLDYAALCHDLSGGSFDITSGVLRRVWKFDGSDRVPDTAAVAGLLPSIGFSKLRWQPPMLELPEGMEIDLGGIGKEYAVDRAFAILDAMTSSPFLVNFGGDLRASRPPAHGAWQVGVERPDHEGDALMLLDLESGALATSGDSHRYLLRGGVRYGHVLDARTGWPAVGAPRSVTVAAASCTEAGMWATLALLQGANCASFLQSARRRHWIVE